MCALSPRLRHVLHPIRALPPSHSALCPSVLLPPQSDSCQHALGHVMSVLPHHPRKPAYSTRPNPILDAASSSPQGYLASSPPVPARCRNISTDYQGYPGGYVSTLRDAHVSHNSIPGPQGVQSSGETAPVMGRSLITTRASLAYGTAGCPLTMLHVCALFRVRSLARSCVLYPRPELQRHPRHA